MSTPAHATWQAWSARQSAMSLLRFITCGSVDDGKSTLIGQLLWHTGQVHDDQVQALQADSRRHGTRGGDIDWALLLDGLSAEREQGITIDVAYRHFASERRRYIVADTPGHEQYTRNMVTGASTADAAVLLVDARHGLRTQTRRHACLVALLGIRHVALAVNKMDLVGFDCATFERLAQAFADFARPLGLAHVNAIPVCARDGDNLTQLSGRTPWYDGPTLLQWLDGVDVPPPAAQRTLLPVQWVNRPDADFRGYSGTLVAGRLARGDEVRITASGHTARISRLVTADGDLPHADAGDALTVVLDREIDVSRGDVITLASQPADTSDHLEATLVWMHDEGTVPGRTYDLQLATQWAGASLSAIRHGVDLHTLDATPLQQMQLNDIAVVELRLSRPVAFEPYAESRALGGFILVDRHHHATVAAGMIRRSLRAAQHVHRQALNVSRADRQKLNGHAGRVLWFTGLSGSGKSTIANALEQHLHGLGLRTYLLDGDNVRHGLNRDLDFTPAGRAENIRRVAEVARLMMDAGLVVLTAFISPYRAERQMARELVGAQDFVEIFVDTPLAICEERDPKGLYRLARSGRLPEMTGVGSPYEAPSRPDHVVRGHGGEPGEIARALWTQVLASSPRADAGT
jgi:bifunctional enzyme CysN/CysC